MVICESMLHKQRTRSPPQNWGNAEKCVYVNLFNYAYNNLRGHVSRGRGRRISGAGVLHGFFRFGENRLYRREHAGQFFNAKGRADFLPLVAKPQQL